MATQDHIKSKKHRKAVELKKERYPGVMKRMVENTTAGENEEEGDRPNNGDRLQYRWGVREHIGSYTFGAR